jgi:hypothetical protein
MKKFSNIVSDWIVDNPSWIRMFILLSIVSIGIMALSYAARTQQTTALLPPTATFQERLDAEQVLHDEEITRCAFLPVRLFIGWISFALVLYYTCVAFSPLKKTRLKQIVSLEVYGESILVLGSIVSAASVLFAVQRPKGIVTMPLSAAMLVDADNGVMQLFLNSINVFQLLYIIFLIYGVRKITDFGKIKSSFIVLVVWGMCIFNNMAMIKFVQERMRLQF